MQYRYDDKRGRPDDKERIEHEVDMYLREEFKRLDIQQRASGGPALSEARYGRQPAGG